MAKPKSQRERRRYIIFRDQHNRRWGGEIEKETGDPCYELQPQGWSAPIMPPSEYVRVVQLEMGRVEIAYRAWAGDLDQRRKEWRQQLETYCHGMYGEKAGEVLDAEAAGKPLPVALLRLVGPPPLSTGPVLACQAESRWALGFTDKRPDWAKDYPDWPFNRAVAKDELAKFRDDPSDRPEPALADPSEEDVKRVLDSVESEPDEDETLFDGGEDGGAMAAASVVANAEESEVEGAPRRRARSKG